MVVAALEQAAAHAALLLRRSRGLLLLRAAAAAGAVSRGARHRADGDDALAVCPAGAACRRLQAQLALQLVQLLCRRVAPRLVLCLLVLPELFVGAAAGAAAQQAGHKDGHHLGAQQAQQHPAPDGDDLVQVVPAGRRQQVGR
jgi:TRAP-type mannitol/chloroaromatic compound transport system permease large subunit